VVQVQFTSQEAINLFFLRFGLPLFPRKHLQTFLDNFFPLQHAFNSLEYCVPPGFLELELMDDFYLVKVT
jgi:hypothetical protein